MWQLTNQYWYIIINYSLQFTLKFTLCCKVLWILTNATVHLVTISPFLSPGNHIPFHHHDTILFPDIICDSPFHSFSPPLWTTSNLFPFSIVLPSPECHITKSIYYVAFSDWFLSLSNMHWRFLQSFYWLDSSFLSYCLNEPQFVRPFTKWKTPWLLPIFKGN